MQSIRDTLIKDGLPTWVTLQSRSRLIPSRLRSILASTRLPGTERGSRSCPCSWPFRRERGVRFGGLKNKKGGRRIVVVQLKNKAMEDPMDLCPGLVARPASWRSSRFEGLSLPLSSLSPFLHSFLPSVFTGGLIACALFCCPCYAEMDVDREMRRLTCFLYLHLVFVKLKASVPCNPPTRFTAPC